MRDEDLADPGKPEGGVEIAESWKRRAEAAEEVVWEMYRAKAFYQLPHALRDRIYRIVRKKKDG